MANPEVEDYFARLPADRRERVQVLHQMIMAVAPDARMDMSYRMPSYHLGEGWVALASQKRHVALYTCGEHHLREFRLRHPDIDTGKGCIRLKPTAQWPLDDLREVVRHAFEHPKPQHG